MGTSNKFPNDWMLKDGTGNSTVFGDERGWIRKSKDGTENVIGATSGVGSKRMILAVTIPTPNYTAVVLNNVVNNYTINWGDGNIDADTTGSHLYVDAGDYIVTILGDFYTRSIGGSGSGSGSGGGIVLDSFIAGVAFTNGVVTDIIQFGNFGGNVLDAAFGSYTGLISATDDAFNGGKVTSANNMFALANFTDIDVSNWDVTTITSCIGMFDAVPLSTASYNKLLLSWSKQNVQPGVVFDAPLAIHTEPAARNILTSAPNNWIITDSAANQ